MSTTGLIALALGLVVLLVCARLAPPTADDSVTKWEGSFGLLLLAIIVGAPVWAAQGVLTFLATVPNDTTWRLWLAWWGAPVVGFAIGGRRGPRPA